MTGHLAQGSGTILVCPVSCVHSQVDILRSYLSPRCPGRLATTATSSSFPWCRTTRSYRSQACEVHSYSFYSLLSSSCFSCSCDSSYSSSSSSLSLSSGPAPPPTPPSVIYSLFSFYCYQPGLQSQVSSSTGTRSGTGRRTCRGSGWRRTCRCTGWWRTAWRW